MPTAKRVLVQLSRRHAWERTCVMPTAKRALVQLGRRHTWKRMHAWNLKRQCSVAPERCVPGGGEQLPGWVAVCTAQSMPAPPAHTQTKPPRVLTPTCSHESTPTPPHRTPTLAAANSFPLSQSIHHTRAYAPRPPFQFPPFSSQYGYTHTHTHTHKTTTEDDDAATLHLTCILKFFYLLMLGFG